MPAQQGHLALVLHAHLPWVRHPERADTLEERWLFEAITETYLPLLAVANDLLRDRVPFRLTLSLSPTLLGMLDDSLLQTRYLRHLDRLIVFTEEEVRRLRNEPQLLRVAVLYRNAFRAAQRSFCDIYAGNLIPAFRRLQDEGALELLTCPATHAYLPLLASNPKLVEAQVRVGLDEYRRHFGQDPPGLWLPECGFVPALDETLARAGAGYVILEAHGIALATPQPVFGFCAPVVTPAGTPAFARDPGLARQVWSATEGYPGDPDYRDFHRDAGFDLPEERVRSLLVPSGDRVHTGIKYHRITGATDAKEPYEPDAARGKANAHASNFMATCARRIRSLAPSLPGPPMLMAAYDAELFGHWWFEGPQWLDFLIRKVAYDQNELALATPADFLAASPTLQESMPAASSWGEGGYHQVWLSGENDWIYRHLDAAGERMCALVRAFPEARGPELRALNQAARELLLAQASDWAFIMSRATVVDYAVRRTREHLAHFARLADELEIGAVDVPALSDLEASDSVFPALDYRVYR